MSSHTSLHPDSYGLTNVRVERHPHPYTALKLASGDSMLTMFVTESQLDEIATVLNDAIAERIPCECENGHVIVGTIEGTMTSPAETLTEICDTCDGRGWVLPETEA